LDVACHRIHRFDVTTEPLGRARVEQDVGGRGLLGRQRRPCTRVEVVVGHRHVAGRCRSDGAGLERPGPRAKTAVEDAHIRQARRGQHPPCPGRAGAIPVVVDDDGDAVSHAPPPGSGLHTAPGRQRVAPAPRDTVIAQLVFKGHIHRAGEVAPLVGGPPVGFGQLPAHVQDRQWLIGVKALRQFSCGDQNLVAAHGNDGAT